MALFNEIQVGRFNRFVQKLLAIKGQPPMPTVASDLQFIHSFLSGFETRVLQSWDTFFFTVSCTPTTGVATIEIRNPAGSNAIAVLERCLANSSTTSDRLFLQQKRGAGTTDQPTVGGAAVQNMDTRGRPLPTCVVTSNAGAAAVALGAQNYASGPVGTNVNTELIAPSGGELLIMPGDAIVVVGSVALDTVVASFVWRERFFEDSERSS